jgi:hypothetical protein
MEGSELMLVAAGSNERDGKKMLFVGLQEENLRELRSDRPIEKQLEEIPGLEGWVLYIFGPEDTARFVAQFGPKGVQT